jgi:hypothetical protein
MKKRIGIAILAAAFYIANTDENTRDSYVRAPITTMRAEFERLSKPVSQCIKNCVYIVTEKASVYSPFKRANFLWDNNSNLDTQTLDR